MLRALERAKKDVDYYALDLSLPELERTLSAVPPGTYEHVRCHGLHGTYDDGLEWLKNPCNAKRPKCVMWLGSSVGNFKFADACDFLRNWARALGPRDTMLVAVDTCQDKDKVYHAYNDSIGKTHEFVLNGLAHANRLMGKEVFKLGEWKVIGEYDVSADRHHAFVTPIRDVCIDGVAIASGERVRIEESFKLSPSLCLQLWEKAGLTLGAQYRDVTGQYRKYMSFLNIRLHLHTKYLRTTHLENKHLCLLHKLWFQALEIVPFHLNHKAAPFPQSISHSSSMDSIPATTLCAIEPNTDGDL